MCCGRQHPAYNGKLGISIYPDDGLDMLTLVRNADTAMYQAKERVETPINSIHASLPIQPLNVFALNQTLEML
ncbi:diguanylate cyclase [Candidatus Reidiella endopervernicosa]|uniref:Diguanylate cyclase n=1 Tax=Candidatus Reidiella endopervernicosa TaxID=2738883 RepID=A0A6N0I1E2_9GAMM|nr:diguanylate cyclase [Candidatus Reidiella endopervernicosa]